MVTLPESASNAAIPPQPCRVQSVVDWDGLRLLYGLPGTNRVSRGWEVMFTASHVSYKDATSGAVSCFRDILAMGYVVAEILCGAGEVLNPSCVDLEQQGHPAGLG